jgi:heme exporter protein A
VALSGVSFSLPEAHTLVVLGPNGAGKTTLLKVLATLLRPHSGLVRVLGSELPGEAWKVRGQVGYLGHEPLLYKSMTARENLAFNARLHGVGDDRVAELLDAVGLTRRADDRIEEFSRGMRQRLAAARAVLHDPPLLLLDEPTANLDPHAAALMEPLIGAASGRTRVLTSHDPVGGLEGADVALGLRAGRVELLAPASEVTRDDIGALYGTGQPVR